MQVPAIWNPYDVHGPQAPANLSPTNLRIVVSSNLGLLNGDLSATSSSDWYNAGANHWNSGGLGSYPLAIVPADNYTTVVAILSRDACHDNQCRWIDQHLLYGEPRNICVTMDLGGLD